MAEDGQAIEREDPMTKAVQRCPEWESGSRVYAFGSECQSRTGPRANGLIRPGPKMNHRWSASKKVQVLLIVCFCLVVFDALNA